MSEPRDSLEVTLTPGYFVMLVIGGIGSFGIIALFLYLVAMWYPRRIDDAGIRDFVRVVPGRNGSFQIAFHTGKVIVPAALIQPLASVHDQLRRRGIQPASVTGW